MQLTEGNQRRSQKIPTKKRTLKRKRQKSTKKATKCENRGQKSTKNEKKIMIKSDEKGG